MVKLKATDGHSTVTAKKTITVRKLERIRDGHFIGFANGVVRDTKTGLEWVAGPDKDTDWWSAKIWPKGLTIDGGRWRMPTTDELKTLYENGRGSRNMTSLLKNTGWYVWSGEGSASAAWSFDFSNGKKHSFTSYYLFARAFAVRSRR